MGMPMDAVTSYQSVAELFLLRYHGRASIAGWDGEDPQALRDVVENYQMLLAYGFDPEFRKALAESAFSDPATADRRGELAFVLALEMMLSKSGRWLYNRMIPEDRQRELEAAYPEVFGAVTGKVAYTTAELLGAASSPMADRDRELVPLCSALGALFPEGFEPANAMRALNLHGSFLSIEPSWMRELDDFQAKLASDAREVLTGLGDRSEIDVDQSGKLQVPGPAVELIFCIANEATLVRWFRTLTPEEREKALTSSQELGWDGEDLVQAMDRRFAWSKEGGLAPRRAMDAAESYRQYGMSEAALFIYQTLVEDVRVQERERAECHNRIAVIHREEGRGREAFLEFQEAGIIWEALGAKWEGAVTSAFVAEGYNSEGKKDKAEKYLEEAFALISQGSESPEKMARGYLYLAGCANAIGRTDLERRALKDGMAFAQSLEDGELFIELNDRLLGIPK